MRRFVWNASQMICTLFFVADNLVQLRLAQGPSMIPTLDNKNNIILIDMLSPRLQAYRRGDIVMSKSMVEPDWSVCKRIIAMPGDIVCANPTESEESARKFVKVPRNCVWLQGDNLDQSRDSRNYGPVPIPMLQGKVIYRVGTCNFNLLKL